MQSGFLGEDGIEVRMCVQSQIGQAQTLLCYRAPWKPGFSLGTHAFLVFLSHSADHQDAGCGGGPFRSAVAALPRPGGGEFLPEPALPQPWLPSLLPPLHLREQRHQPHRLCPHVPAFPGGLPWTVSVPHGPAQAPAPGGQPCLQQGHQRLFPGQTGLLEETRGRDVQTGRGSCRFTVRPPPFTPVEVKGSPCI